MLLVSAITPSGRTWAREAAELSVPGVTFIDSTTSQLDTGSDIGGAFEVAGVPGSELWAGLASVRSVAVLSSHIARHVGDEERSAVWFPASVASAVTDLQALALLADAQVVGPLDAPLIHQLRATAAATANGDVELLLVCPPEESAMASAVTEVAVATAAGLRVRGVAVCPMPRKTDGWPRSIRRSARNGVDELKHVLHPITVDRARHGQAPALLERAVDVCDETVSPHTDGSWIWSITIPGLSRCAVSVGTWTSDPAYPTTHVVLDIDGRIVYRAVDSIVRRCAAVEAVLSGDSIAITFEPHADQWPDASQKGVA